MGLKPMEERMNVAILQACRALRHRHRLEEGAHGPALAAFARVAQVEGVHGKVENLQQELNQILRAQIHAKEEFQTQLNASQTYRSQLAEKDSLITKAKEELDTLRETVQELKLKLINQEKALEIAKDERKLLQDEKQELKIMLSEAEKRLSEAEEKLSETDEKLSETHKRLSEVELDNEALVKRWMQLKAQDADRVNEANAMYEFMKERSKGSSLEELAKRQVDGIVRHSEAGAELYVESPAPTQVRRVLHAHESGGTVVAFEHNSSVLYSGGHDRVVKKWDTLGGNSLGVLRGCLGAVLDLSLSVANRQVLAGCSDHKLYLWDAPSCRLRHTLTGHTEKVVSVDLSQVGSNRAVSASHDRTMKLWDLETGYALNTVLCFSNCNAVCVTSDGALMCSGHMDGNLRFWDIRSGKLANEMAAHSQSVTSVTLSMTGHLILTSGRENVHNLFDVRALGVLDVFRSSSYRAATNWTRSCLSPNESYVAAGSTDGTVVLWSRKSGEKETLLKGGHKSTVLACAWSNQGKPLATGDKSGQICLWT